MKICQIGQFVKTNPIQSQTKPICRGVASGEAGSKAKNAAAVRE
jgi:hypothetical protein